MDNDNIQKSIKHLNTENVCINIGFTLALIAVLMMAIKGTITTTKLTEAISNVSQKAGVEFNVKTNTIFGICKVLKPM